MVPVRGAKRKRKAERKTEHNGLASGFSDKEASGDWWDEFSKRLAGLPSPPKGLDRFKTVFKVSRKTFNYICSLVKEDLMAKKPGQFCFSDGKSMSLNDLVAIALRRLSSGDSLLTIGDAFGLNHSTVSQVTWRFVEAMEERGLHHLKWPDEAEMTEIKSKFEKIRGLPNCCGAVDITHIMMCLPVADPSTKPWFDREKNHSMLLQVIVDPDLRFRDIVTGWPGKMSDSSVLETSNFLKLCEKGERLNGKKVELPGKAEIGEYIVGDSGFPLLPWLITPYAGNDLPEPRAGFNRRHSATRKAAEQALTRLKETWKILHGVMWRPDKNKLPRIILVCCLLHNITIEMEDEVLDEISMSKPHDTGYRQQVCESADKTASVLRDMLSLYLCRKP